MWDFPRLLAASAAATFMMANSSATVLYVDVNGPNPQPPYTTWTTAATNIQDAIDAATAGDFILVTNGVYSNGGRLIAGASSQAAVTNAIVVESVNGPAATIICPDQPTNSARCVYLANGALLSGFTLTNGNAFASSGGAVYAEPQGVVSNCIIADNRGDVGGGVFGGTYSSCVISSNWAYSGGGVYGALLKNCLIISNLAFYGGGSCVSTQIGCTISNNSGVGGGGGVFMGTATNSLIVGNYTPSNGGGARQSTLDHCVLSNNVSAYAGGAAVASTLAYCTVVGNSITSTNNTAGGGGVAQSSLVWCGVSNNWAASFGGGTADSTLTNCVVAANYAAGSGGGAYQGMLEGCTVVNNSCGGSGGGSLGSTLSHCTIQANTAMGVGGGVSAGTLLSSTVVSNYAGSTGGGLQSCSASDCSILANLGTGGAGVYGGNITNCLLAYNRGERAYYPRGGAACLATLDHCTIATNSASEGAGVESGYVYNSVLIGNVGSWGGGAAYSTLDHCAIGANVGGPAGAGGCSLTGCLITNNIGIGVLGGWVNSCTVAGNEYGAVGGTFVNSIVYENSDSNWEFYEFYGLHFTNCCTTPIPTNYVTTFSSMSAADTFTNDPVFVNPAVGNYHLQPSSPCINSGKNSYVTTSTDLDGNPRIKGGTVDIGAYEFQSPTSTISYAWLQQYGLPVDGTADLADTDQDGMNNWQEWICGTDPTNSFSVLKMFAPSNTSLGLVLSWQSVAGKTYDLQGSDPAIPATFSTIQSNIVGQADVTGFLDSGATNIGSHLYRVRVNQ